MGVELADFKRRLVLSAVFAFNGVRAAGRRVALIEGGAIASHGLNNVHVAQQPEHHALAQWRHQQQETDAVGEETRGQQQSAGHQQNHAFQHLQRGNLPLGQRSLHPRQGGNALLLQKIGANDGSKNDGTDGWQGANDTADLDQQVNLEDRNGNKQQKKDSEHDVSTKLNSGLEGYYKEKVSRLKPWGVKSTALFAKGVGMSPQDYRLVLNTCPNEAEAKRLAGLLLEQGLAACVNMLPGVRSMYLWKGQLCDDAEVLLLIKTTAASYAALEALLRAEHPYELPEIVAVSFTEGLEGYFSWITDVVKKQ